MASRAPKTETGRRLDLDLEAMADAVRELLRAAGLPEAPELASTPERVAQAWSESFLDGYGVDPGDALGELYEIAPESRPSGLVLLTSIPVHGLCPHHLLPFHGLAHVGYLPGTKLASLSGITRLVDCFSHRLEIQERVTRQIGDALVEHVEVRGSAVVLETDQTCMTLRHPERRGTRTVTQHFAGIVADDERIRAEFLASLRGA